MKIYPIIVAALTLSVPRLNAQAPFRTIDSININKFNASVLVHGDMWWDPNLSSAFCKFPAGDRKSLNFAGALWMSGYDAANNLHIAAQTYRQHGNDYWPGPLDASGSLTYATSQDWAKIWKVNRTDINYFRGLATITPATVPAAILTWPAKGNTYAQGNAGAALTITDDMAPFIDLNGDGIYQPLLGEYPDIPGDQALWWVFSDNGPTHAHTNGNPLKVEVHAMAYGYNRGTLIDNVVYYKFNIVNKSANNYHDFRMGLWNDLDGGYQYSNYIGFDSTWRLAIGYKASAEDNGGGAGHPRNTYGNHCPIVGVTIVVSPGDAGGSYVPAGSFSYYNNDLSFSGVPIADTEFNYYMRSRLRDGQHITNDFMGRGIPSHGYGTGPNCNYAYPGDPSDTSQWSECSSGNNLADKRSVLACSDFTLNAGAKEKMVAALISTDTGAGGGGGYCGNLSFDTIKIIADTAWHIYYHPLAPMISNGISTIDPTGIHIYPNPVHNQLHIEGDAMASENKLIISNPLGQQFVLPVTTAGNKVEVNISALPPGLYYLQYHNSNGYTATKFVKE